VKRVNSTWEFHAPNSYTRVRPTVAVLVVSKDAGELSVELPLSLCKFITHITYVFGFWCEIYTQLPSAAACDAYVRVYCLTDRLCFFTVGLPVDCTWEMTYTVRDIWGRRDLGEVSTCALDRAII
jgi:hypothetical protein